MLVYLLAGEASGDRHGANLARALRRIDPSVRLAGIGGPRMREAGVELAQDMTALATTGLVEVLGKIGEFRRLLARLAAEIERTRPDALVAIDFPDFNLRLAERARPHVRRLFYYISPQIWAWRPGRVRRIGSLVDRVLVIFPFEEALYARHGIPCTFVGHPLLDDLDAAAVRREAAAALPPLPTGTQSIGLLPGSRLGEFARIFPAMAEAGRRLAKDGARIVLRLAPGPGVPADAALRAVAGAGVPIEIHAGRAREVLATSDASLVASGTATLEAALLEAPHAMVYRVHPLTAAVLRPLLKVDLYAMSNILARHAGVASPPVPEFVQNGADPGRMAQALATLLADPAARERQRDAFRRARAALGPPGASDRAAGIILER